MTHRGPGLTTELGAPSSEVGLFEQHGSMLALGILGLGVIFRIEGFTEWWLNPDEGIYYSVLTREHFADFWAQASATAHPPLYFLLLRGLGSLSTDFVWLRSLALVSGSAAVYIFFLVGRELGGTGSRAWLAGLLSGLALAISPRGDRTFPAHSSIHAPGCPVGRRALSAPTLSAGTFHPTSGGVCDVYLSRGPTPLQLSSRHRRLRLPRARRRRPERASETGMAPSLGCPLDSGCCPRRFVFRSSSRAHERGPWQTPLSKDGSTLT